MPSTQRPPQMRLTASLLVLLSVIGSAASASDPVVVADWNTWNGSRPIAGPIGRDDGPSGIFEFTSPYDILLGGPPAPLPLVTCTGIGRNASVLMMVAYGHRIELLPPFSVDGNFEAEVGLVDAIAAYPTSTLASLASGSVLYPGQQLQSPNGDYRLILQADGNLVLYERTGDGDVVRWSSGTAGMAVKCLAMRTDGNLVLYGTDGTPIWSTSTYGQGSGILTLEDGGELRLSSAATGEVLWMSGSGTGAFSGDTIVVIKPAGSSGNVLQATCIKDIQVGQSVYAADRSTATPRNELKTVTRIRTIHTATVVKVHTLYNTLVTTPEQLFLILDDLNVPHWMPAALLNGRPKVLCCANGAVEAVLKVEVLEQATDLYAIEVDDFHSFCVGNTAVIVHNFDWGKAALDTTIKVGSDIYKKYVTDTVAHSLGDYLRVDSKLIKDAFGYANDVLDAFHSPAPLSKIVELVLEDAAKTYGTAYGGYFGGAIAGGAVSYLLNDFELAPALNIGENLQLLLSMQAGMDSGELPYGDIDSDFGNPYGGLDYAIFDGYDGGSDKGVDWTFNSIPGMDGGVRNTIGSLEVFAGASQARTAYAPIDLATFLDPLGAYQLDQGSQLNQVSLPTNIAGLSRPVWEMVPNTVGVIMTGQVQFYSMRTKEGLPSLGTLSVNDAAILGRYPRSAHWFLNEHAISLYEFGYNINTNDCQKMMRVILDPDPKWPTSQVVDITDTITGFVVTPGASVVVAQSSTYGGVPMRMSFVNGMEMVAANSFILQFNGLGPRFAVSTQPLSSYAYKAHFQMGSTGPRVLLTGSSTVDITDLIRGMTLGPEGGWVIAEVDRYGKVAISTTVSDSMDLRAVDGFCDRWLKPANAVRLPDPPSQAAVSAALSSPASATWQSTNTWSGAGPLAPQSTFLAPQDIIDPYTRVPVSTSTTPASSWTSTSSWTTPASSWTTPASSWTTPAASSPTPATWLPTKP